ncbi:hypothetical protein [Niabella aurantiaca]|uniref:hypothetical protein n=1 Tax=Niabella aurantiaca TaxID=379900 RepID=UPI0003694EF2|nr:hypothetical protein [Niabella aurantiaca]
MKQDAAYNILNRIRQEQKTNPGFTLPEGYFEAFTDRLMTTIKETSADEAPLLPLLDAAPRKMPYSVPLRYFTQFRVDRGMVISFKRGLTIAASFILLAVTSIFLFTKKPQTTETASLPAVTAAVNRLTNEQLERFMQPEELPSKEKPAVRQTVNAQSADMTKLFKNVPDAELANFLNETAEGNDEIFLN